MSLDTKFRPSRFEDVLGQQGTIRILRQFIQTGSQFHQSYLFAGPYGSGKTTTARIFARAMLCDAPVAGDPCDQCPSCLSVLRDGTAEGLVEVDAATNSGKADVKKVLEEIEYGTFGGKPRIYLYDEAHQLSRDALDAMLKPMEDNVRGSSNKRLVCIFCTTEPEKMRATILSRCAPAFVIHPVTPDEVAQRLAHVCQQEGIPYDEDALRVIAEITECHVRDCLKAIEGLALLGGVSRESVSAYLHLDRNALYLDILDTIGRDLGAAMVAARSLSQQASPATCYEKLAEAALLAFKVSIGAEKPPVYWDGPRLAEVGTRQGAALLSMATCFASRPGRPVAAMLECDIAFLHHNARAPVPAPAMPAYAQAPAVAAAGGALAAVAPEPARAAPPAAPDRIPAISAPSSNGGGTLDPIRQQTGLTENGVFVSNRAVGHPGGAAARPATGPLELNVTMFAQLLGMRIAELDEAERGPTGRPYMDRH